MANTYTQCYIHIVFSIKNRDALIRREWKEGEWKWPKWGERDPYECAGGPGKSKCLFRRLCLMEEDPWKLEESYDFSQEFFLKEGKWEPWKRRGREEGEEKGGEKQ